MNPFSSGRRGLILTLAITLTASTVSLATVQGAQASSGAPVVQREKSVPVKDAAQVPPTPSGKSRSVAPAQRWPKKDSKASVAVTDSWSKPASTGLSMRSSRKPAAARQFDVTVLKTQDLGAKRGPGLVYEIRPKSSNTAKPGSEASKETLELSVDYSTFAASAGGDWANRLQLVQTDDAGNPIPASAQETGLVSNNDTEKQVVTAKVSAAAAAQPMVVALAATASGSTGDYTATPLASSSSWSAGGQTGDFNWAYPIPTPESINGPAPDLSINYSSASIDGRTSSTNNQASWIGDGFDLDVGFIERSYIPCRDDSTSSNAPSGVGDLCWDGQRLTMSLGGQSSKLIRVGSSAVWRSETDDGTLIERLDGGSNGAKDGEYWRATTTDGTKYYFGKTRRTGDTSNVTDSVSTVPVYGNQSGEPCHASTWAASRCTQAWRWNLDYVVDPHSNSMTLYYAQEKNRYGANKNTAWPEYDRGSVLKKIEYGTRTASEGTTPPFRVVFTTAQRCLVKSGVTCATLDSSHAKDWPDVPFDQVCASTTSCANRWSPAFFSRLRLTTVDAQVRDAAGTYKTIDTWALDQSFPAPGDGSSASLWLSSIQRTGKSQSPAITQPKVRFRSDVLPNRVDQIGDGIQKFLKHRLGTIYNGSGGQISINYLATNCTWENKPTASELDSNTKRCFPSYYTPAGSTTPQLEFFNKWVVDNVVETDGTGGAPDKLTSYTYSGGGAWRYDEGSMLRAKYRTWNQWRGYERVTTRIGHSSENPTSTETLYMRGMHGDRKVGGGTRSVTVTDDVAPDLTDHDYFNGFVRRTSTKLGSGADNVEHEINTPWVSEPTATGGGEARVVAVAKSDTKSPISTGGTRTARVTNTYNNDGLITASEDLGDTSVATDDRCTKTSYAVNSAANISALVSQVVTTAGDCDAAPAGANDVISAERYIYDGGTVGSSPTKGDVTQALSTSGWSSGIHYQVDQTRTYDDYGRVTTEKDAADKPTATAYSPTTGAADSVTTTNALGQSSVTTLDRLRGVPTRTKDAANRVTDVTYDALGRTTAVWKPGRAKATQTATAKYTYTDSDTAPGVIKTERLNAADEYVASFEMFDGLLRPRSTQSRAAGVGGGRLITETQYDSRGWVSSERGPFYNSSAPSGNLVTAADNATPTMTAYEYDLAGRTTRELTKSFGDDLWQQRTAYDADRVRVTPPAGETATTTFSDARGQTTALIEHAGTSPAGPGEATTYVYTKRGELKTITNQAGSKWEKSYDIRGRLITDVDPDKGSSTFTYDALDRQLTSTDARGITLWTQYDALGREVKTRDDNSNGTPRTTRVYDTVVPGMATSSTRHTAAGDYTSSVVGYDAAGRPTGTKLMLPSSETALYKAAGYVTNLTYNVDGSVKTVQLPSTTGLPSETLQFGYDALGNQTQLAGYSSIVPETILSPFGEVLQRTYKSALQKGVYETRDYQVGTRRLERRMGSLEGSGTTAILDQRYTYDPAGNVKTLNDIAAGDTTGAGADSFRQCFTYDHLRRMTQAWTSATTNCAAPTKETLGEKDPYWDSYQFDSSGNRTQWEKVRGSGPNQTSTRFQSSYPAATAAHPHALSSVAAVGDQTGTEVFEYDQTGNTTSRSASASATQTYEWDREGRVKSVVHEGSAESAEYVYDANGNRLIARDSASNSTTLFAGMVEVKATGSTVTSTRQYTLGGEKVATRISGSISFLISDHQGTPQVSVLGASQAVTKRRFSPYGDPLVEPVSWPSDRGFLGKTTDRALGTTHLEAREYDTALGRFLTVDPVIDPMDPQQLNGYAYANNSPVTMMDPDGLWPGWAKPSWGGIKGAASGAFRTVVFDYKACSGMSWGCAFEVASATPWTKVAKAGKFVLKANPRTAVFTKTFSSKPTPKVPAANRTTRKVQDTPKSRKAPDPAPKAKPDTEAPKTAKASACSFTGATTVLMADGSRKPIRKVKVGDKVLASEPANGRKVVRKVLTVFKHRDAVLDLKLSSGSVLSTTPDHPFWNASDGEFQRADALSKSDELLTPKGGALTAVGLQRSTVRWAEAYNLEIDDVHTYFVGEDEILVHNQNTCDGPASNQGAKPDAPEKSFQTYVKTNQKTGEIYAGRTSGYGSPADNITRRDASHAYTARGFGPAVLDKSSSSREAIRGREQQLIDAQRNQGISANAINGISPTNSKKGAYMEAAIEEFGVVP